jgi:hypothetical protein
MKTIVAIAAIAMVTSTPALAGSGWKASEVSSIIDGRLGSAALLAGKAVASDGTELPARLNLSCQKNTTYFIVEPDRKAKPALLMDFAYSPHTAVRAKLNDYPIVRVTWHSTPNYEAFGAVGAEAIDPLKRFAAIDKGQPMTLTIEARGMSGNATTFIFQISGIKDAIAPIAKECGW